MNAVSTRRGMLKGTAAVVTAVVAPAAVAASPDNRRDWERVKETYRQSQDRLNFCCDLISAAEKRRYADEKSAPQIEITYMEEGFSTKLFTMPACETTETLTLKNYRAKYLPPSLTATPEYQAYHARMDAWEKRPERQAALQQEREANDAWRVACNAETEAWRAAATFPVENASMVADKIAVLTPCVTGEPESLEMLVQAVASDLARIGRRA